MITGNKTDGRTKMSSKKFNLFIALILTAVFAVVSCQSPQQTETEKPKTTATTPLENAPPASETVIATILDGEENITWEELDRNYHVARMRSRISREQVDKLLDNLVRQHLVYLDGIEKGYDKDPEYIAQIERAKRQYINRIAMRKMARERTDVSDDEIRAYYDANREEFSMLELKYLLFSSRKYEKDSDLMRKEAGKALKALKKGMSMEEVGKKFLDRERAFELKLRKNRGSFFGKEFDDTVWGLEPGKFTGLIETQQGIIIAKVINKKSQNFDESKEYVKHILMKEKSMARMDNYYESLKKKYSYQLNEENLERKISEAKTSQPPQLNGPPPSRPTMATPPPRERKRNP